LGRGRAALASIDGAADGGLDHLERVGQANPEVLRKNALRLTSFGSLRLCENVSRKVAKK